MRAGRRADLPVRRAGRKRPGPAPRSRSFRAAFAHPARQSFQGHAGAVAPAAEGARDRRRAARPCRHQGPGERQARARGRRRRRPQPADDRPARRRQVDAGRAAADDPAAADAGRIAGSVDDRLRRRRDRRRRAHQPAAVPLAASFRVACRRWSAAACARGRARSRSRTTACCSSTRCRNSQPQVLDALRQPLESGEVAIARANHRITYPARFMLVAAMNPCRCGRANDPGFACKRGPNTRCVAEYQTRLSGPLLDRIDLHIEVPAVTAVRPDPAAAVGRQPRSGGTRRARARSASRALRRARAAQCAHQCAGQWTGARSKWRAPTARA